LLVDVWTALRTAGELTANMGAPNLYKRSLDLTTSPPDFEVTHSDAARHLQAREEQVVGLGLDEKALVWGSLCG